MSIIGQLAARRGQGRRVVARARGETPVPYILRLPLSGLDPGETTKAYLKAYGEMGWLFACVSRIASSVGEARLHCGIVDRDGAIVEELNDHPMLQLMRMVNPFMTGQELYEYTEMWLELAGVAYWVYNFTGSTPTEIWPVPPDRMRIVPSRDGFIEGYKYVYGEVERTFKVDRVTRFFLPDPNSLYGGKSPAQSLAVELDTDAYAAAWNRDFFLNNARADGIITSKTPLTEEQYERLQNDWMSGHRGVGMSHRIGVLEGEVDYKQISVAHSDMAFIDLRKLNRDAILGAFGIPMHILGLTETTNRATAESAEYVYARWVIYPRLQRIAKKLNESYVPLWGAGGIGTRRGGHLELWFDDPTPENEEANRTTAVAGVKGGFLTVNEARAMIGLGRIENGNVLQLPTNVQLVEAIEPGTRRRGGRALAGPPTASIGGRCTHGDKARDEHPWVAANADDPFVPEGAAEGLPPTADDQELTEEEIEAAIREWNRRMQGHWGLLEAEIEETEAR